MQSYSFTDNISEFKLSDKISYRLKQLDLDGIYEYSKEVEVIIPKPTNYYLAQNYPNPFNPKTTVKYQIPELSFVTLKIYDVLGNEVRTLVSEEKPAGEYKVEFYQASSIKNPVSGVYFYQLQAGNFVQTKKMLLLK